MGFVGVGDLAERSERCACVPKVASSIRPSDGSESTFRSDLPLTATGSNT
jgi:hypothetical protein